MSDLPPDPTLDEIRVAVRGRLPNHAAFDGWSDAALAMAAGELGVDADVARLALPGGQVDLIDAWFASVDEAMAARVTPQELATMKVRDRITALVTARLEALAPHREALRRAVAILAMPQNLAKAAALSWRSADLMWRLAGDTATDYNHYTKRLMLGGVYAATIAAFLDDESEGFADTRAFLDRRIAGIMRFEKAKAGFLARAERRPSLARFIGRLRYPAV